ncbi:MAG: lysophospholipid acyltransferase family protein [Mycobacterium sp.]|nr:lysophospholipid acyltransferase family protein [Mycobacterium sp.]
MAQKSKESDVPPEPGDFTGEWDPELIRRIVTLGRPIYKLWFRSEVRGLDQFPDGGALIVSNHSGGINPPDVPIFWVDFFEKFGYDRPIYTLTHDLILRGPLIGPFTRMGMIRATRENANKALRSGATVIVFPGGDYDALRPTSKQSTIDFDGRTGYVSTAIEAGVPIVPVVSIGGQETQLFLTRGKWLAKRLPLKRLTRAEEFAVSIGFPFGLSIGALNLPLPSKIVTQVLPAIDIKATFGKKPDVAEVDEHVRAVMQEALSGLAAERRLPILG